ncbi:Geranylgeranyl pyrophosphate synthetase [Pleurostoma richardsiae]|uniref:Geranylgeranyl pyrophosphate synthetase n=1 Tax=Pleurostoma richardsiae TaxID=41990 RepID=A0AA38VRH1_9PEZI|nr:Geranylgeranyl pyrophosphate synthetase [Pleurostoma richardsiae]
MVSCECGQIFQSDAALAQHRADKARLGDRAHLCQVAPAPSAVRATAARPRHSRIDVWIWKDVISRKALRTIDGAAIQPAATPVSSQSACDLVSSYNWQDTAEPRIRIPGRAPMWQDVPLPITLSKDSGRSFKDQNAARVPNFPFEPLFRAAALMNPSFRFDDVDIVVNRNSLRKLLDFSEGRVPDTFRVNLLLVRNTLFIERCERSARQLVQGSADPGFGRSFERTFTKFPNGAEDSTAYHRVLRYSLGGLNCVVRFEVDACYDTRAAEQPGKSTDPVANVHDIESITVSMGTLALGGLAVHEAAQQADIRNRGDLMRQSAAAEIKVRATLKPPRHYLPQLWFGRTPWLIIGHHMEGTVNEIKVTDAAALFEDWETRHQASLRRMVAILVELREAARRNGGRSCVAICERNARPHAIKIFAAEGERRPLPEELIRQFWAMEGEGPVSGSA